MRSCFGGKGLRLSAGFQNQLHVATHFAEPGTVNSRGRLKLVFGICKDVREDGDGGGAPSAELHI